MTTDFIATEVPLTSAGDLPQRIELALRQWGEPLRWAVTAVDETAQTVRVEAVVTRESPHG